MTDLSPEARSIIEAGRDGDGAGDLERARVRRALMAKIAAGGATLAASSAAAGGSTVASISILKVVGPIIVLLAGGVGGTLAWRAHRQSMAPAPVAAAPSPVMAPKIVPMASAPTVAPAPAEPVRRAPPRHARVAARAEASTTDRLAEETALLAASNAQLRAGDARRALALLNDYDRRYPTGVLREEVLATRVIAGCQIGLEPDAASRRAADKFLRRHPATPLASRVRSSCAR